MGMIHHILCGFPLLFSAGIPGWDAAGLANGGRQYVLIDYKLLTLFKIPSRISAFFSANGEFNIS